MRQRTATALVLVIALALLGAASASGDNALKCFGERATMVSSGLITGTEGDDVIVGSNGPTRSTRSAETISSALSAAMISRAADSGTTIWTAGRATTDIWEMSTPTCRGPTTLAGTT